ncbi:patatin-like protein 2 [Vitis vinifera]|uniref:patatin-like protein 2 n=1 Tax=Vitis vinifera TaxID=29760 RepID=UPI001FC4D29A|nr:patatin-like protein 2 [Vitis vinifera]
MASTQGSSPTTNRKVITILSIDGGGFRGIIPAVILSALEAELQRLDGPDARIADYFDLIAGTSTGSIVTAFLTTPYPLPSASNGSTTNRPCEAKDIQQFYIEHGPEIFAKEEDPVQTSKSESFLDGLKHLIVQGVEKVLEYKYRPSRLSEKVDEQLGKIRLADTLTNVLVPAYDIQHLKLVTFSSHQARKADSSVKLRDVVMSSAAAPVFFPSHNFEADGRMYNLVDGGVAANNPTLLAIQEADHIFGNRDYNYLILSLGTCSEEEHQNFIDLTGPLPWMIDLKRGTPPLANVLFKTSADMVDAYTLFVLGVGGRISSQNFLRIQDNTLKPEQLTMDDASKKNFESLIDIAQRLLEKPVSFPSLVIGLQPMTTNRKALMSFARLLSEEKKRRGGSLFHVSGFLMCSIISSLFLLFLYKLYMVFYQ